MQSEQNIILASNIISQNYIDLAKNALNSRNNQITTLLSQRSLPQQGWDTLQIEYFLQQLAQMDTNNFQNKIGIGEREGRVYSQLVQKKNYFMSHGIGRSGDIAAEQPKAAGSSLMYKLTCFLAKDALKIMGVQFIKDLIVLPLATGMSLSITLLSIQKQKPLAKYVIWPRIDQKTCLKCILTANLIPLVVEGKIDGDSIRTDTEDIQNLIKQYGQDNILCILPTTSCFAPRIFDDIEKIAIICKTFDIFCVVNNAYGLQCQKIIHCINQGCSKGRVDAVIQSTDKNFMVPVGGSIIYSPQKQCIQIIKEIYPGRASGAPILDLFITLLEMGKDGLENLLSSRKQNLIYMKEKLKELGDKFDERILDTPLNSISIGFTLKSLTGQFYEEDPEFEIEKNKTTSLGSILYSKRVMGSRILTKKKVKKICGQEFKNYGSNIEDYPHLPYMTIACAIGIQKYEIDQLVKKLETAFLDFQKKITKQNNEEFKENLNIQ